MKYIKSNHALLLHPILQEEQQVIPPVVENMYCRVYASLRTSQGKKHIFVFRIMNLDNLNDLTRHVLEVMYSSLKIQKIKTSEITMVSRR